MNYKMILFDYIKRKLDFYLSHAYLIGIVLIIVSVLSIIADVFFLHAAQTLYLGIILVIGFMSCMFGKGYDSGIFGN